MRHAGNRLGQGERLSMLTLTTQNTPLGALAEGFDHHIASVKRLVETLGVNLTWGQFQIEITSNGAGFHVHSHGIIRAQFIPQDWLVERWIEASYGWGMVLDIREVYGTEYGDAAKEASKYPTKPLDMRSWSDAMLGEAIEALAGRKRCFTIHPLARAKPMATPKVCCPKCQGPMVEVARLAWLVGAYGESDGAGDPCPGESR